MSELDLHGVKHADAEVTVENFVYSNQDNFPLKIICGNSGKMIAIAQSVLNKIGCEHTMYRYGIITIGRFT